MIELFIGGAMIAVVIFLLGGRRSDPDSRSFVPNDKVATSSGAYEAGLCGNDPGRENNDTWTGNGRVSRQYPRMENYRNVYKNFGPYTDAVEGQWRDDSNRPQLPDGRR